MPEHRVPQALLDDAERIEAVRRQERRAVLGEVEEALTGDKAIQELYIYLPEIVTDDDAGPSDEEAEGLRLAMRAALLSFTDGTGITAGTRAYSAEELAAGGDPSAIQGGKCERCGGSGKERGQQPPYSEFVCSACGGTGEKQPSESDRERADRLEVECRELEDANRSLAKMRDAALEGKLSTPEPSQLLDDEDRERLRQIAGLFYSDTETATFLRQLAEGGEDRD